MARGSIMARCSTRWLSNLATRSRRRVVVTGMGLVTCLGVGVQHVWERLLAGECGLHALDSQEFGIFPSQVGGTVPRGTEPGQLDMDKFISKSEQRGKSLATCFAMVAAEEALKQAEWKPSEEKDKIATGVAVGMGMVSLDDIVSTGQAMKDFGYKKVSPYLIPTILVNLAAGNISVKYGFKGVNHAVSTACTSGLHSIGDASRFIQHGDVDVMVCGGAEACLTPMAIAGFSKARALSTKFNDRPKESSRPFDEERDGFVMSEGAGILVLEEYEHAKQRGARILGEILGYGLSGDATHITAPSDTGDGAYRCMQAAMKDAGIDAKDVGYINAHATSTPLGDIAESRAIGDLFGPNCKDHLAVSSTKGSIGHLQGAAGSVEAIIALMACHTGVLPPTLNCYNPDTGVDLNYVPHKSAPWPEQSAAKRIALTNSFGFGGTNGSLCLAGNVS